MWTVVTFTTATKRKQGTSMKTVPGTKELALDIGCWDFQPPAPGSSSTEIKLRGSHWVTAQSTFYFERSQLCCPGCVSTSNLPASATQSARINGIYHHTCGFLVMWVPYVGTTMHWEEWLKLTAKMMIPSVGSMWGVIKNSSAYVYTATNMYSVHEQHYS